ncbi:MAG: hypothetical protein M3033_17625 [Acidobacteriota bacterium]|nr:hypothetical protein [Acidobacteriota bacterium]
MKKLTLALILVVGFALAGCSKASEQTNTANQTVSNPTSIKPAETNSASTSTAHIETGVAACDEYLTKVETCLNKPNMPDAMKSVYRQSLEQNRTAWKQAASTEQGKASLQSSCKMALDSAKSFLETSCK